jgi:putative sigma-54 modulation protein
MQFEMNFRNLEPTDAIKQYAEKRSVKLTKFFHDKDYKEGLIKWTFSIDHKAQIAHCQVSGHGFDFNSEVATDYLYKSMDEVVDKMMRQLRDHKKQVVDHKKQEPEQKKQVIADAAAIAAAVAISSVEDGVEEESGSY